MKANSATVVVVFCALSAASALADPELDALMQKGQATPSVSPPTAHVSPEHVVKPGDSLEKIARLHGCRVSDLIRANGLKTESIIRPGQKLTLPAIDHSQSTVLPPSPPTSQNAVATHTVAAGETFAAIARHHGIPLNEVLAANPEIKPTALRPGQTIRLGQASTFSENRSLDTGNTHMILATKEESTASASPLASPPTVKIQQIKIDREMTYHEFASRQGTNTRRLNQLNGLDLLDSALLAKGSELLAPAQP